MFPNSPVTIGRLVRARQEEIARGIRRQPSAPAFRGPWARPRLGRLIGLLVAAGWLISNLI
jgi:hypothetical protein